MLIKNHIVYDQFQVISFIVILIFSLSAWFNKYLPINYGKNFATFFPFSIPGRIAWFIYEIPNLVITAHLFYQIRPSNFNFFLMAPFLIHYINRAIIYPLRLKGKPKSIPIEICILSFTFTTCNSYFQATSIFTSKIGDWPDIFNAKNLLGLVIFFVGMWINISSDSRLQQLKEKVQSVEQNKYEKKEYVIPSGWLFDYVSQPNYLGEIIEWLGFAIFQPHSLAGWVFCFSTLSVLTSRALDNHAWYHRTFPYFPKERKAVIPFVI